MARKKKDVDVIDQIVEEVEKKRLLLKPSKCQQKKNQRKAIEVEEKRK